MEITNIIILFQQLARDCSSSGVLVCCATRAQRHCSIMNLFIHHKLQHSPILSHIFLILAALIWDKLKERLKARLSCPASISDITNVLLEKRQIIFINIPKPWRKPSQKSKSCDSCKGWLEIILNGLD